MDNQDKIRELLNKYKSSGVHNVNIFALPPSIAPSLVIDLEESKIVIAGVEVWYYVKEGEQILGIREDLSYGAELFVPEHILQGEHAAEESAEIVKGYLDQLPKDVELVALVLYKSTGWWS